jgi:hypothetical protein
MKPDEAYAAGYDCAKMGTSIVNSSRMFFETPELIRSWESGKRDGTIQIENENIKNKI